MASLNKAILAILAFFVCSLNKANGAAGLPWWRIRWHQFHKEYVLVREDLSSWRRLTEEEQESLQKAMKMHPEMLRYMLENSWAGDSLQRPWWSPKRACWQRQEETPFPAKEIVLGAKAKAKPHKRGSSQKASSERAKKEPKEEKEEYSYTYNYSTEEDEPEKGQKEVKLDCRSQQWHEEEDEEGDPVRVTTEDRWGSQGWQPAGSSSSSWEPAQGWASSSWQAADSQQWQWDSWGWTEWQEWHASPWRTDPDPTWGDWSWRGQFQSEQDRYQNKFVKSEKDDDDRVSSDEESSSWNKKLSRGYLSQCRRLERRKLAREGKEIPVHLQARETGWSVGTNEKRRHLQNQLNSLQEDYERSRSKSERTRLWEFILAKKNELKKLLQPEDGTAGCTAKSSSAVEPGKGKSKGKMAPPDAKGQPAKGKGSLPPPEPAKGKAAAKAARADPIGPISKAGSKGKPAQGTIQNTTQEEKKPEEGDDDQEMKPEEGDDSDDDEPKPEQGDDKKEDKDDKPEKGRVKEEPDYN